MKTLTFTASTALACLLGINLALAATPDNTQISATVKQLPAITKAERQSQLLKQRQRNTSLTQKQYQRLASLVKQLPAPSFDHRLMPPAKITAVHSSLGQSQQAAEQLDYAHLLLDMNIARSDEDGKDYLIFQAKSSIFGGSRATYIDLFLESGDWIGIGDPGTEMAFNGGKNTRVQAKISLAELTQNYGDQEMIRVSSWLDIEAHDGTTISQLIFSQYPIPWQQINARMQSATQPTDVTDISAQQMTLTVNHPGDLNQDNRVKLCLNFNYPLCDYADIYNSPDQVLAVPLQGQLVLPYQVAAITPSDQLSSGLTGIIDSQTGIYLQNEYSGYSLSPSLTAPDGQVKTFSDYLTLSSDPGQGSSTITWDIPRQEVDLLNWRYLHHSQQIDWHITLVLNGYPTASAKESQTPIRFQITLSSDQAAGFSHFALPTLNTFDIEY
ncbi:hypothetical protein [Thalassomonas haliotis]|uniref:Uncharacterized protein n=1 Tax=Thalassomonas haliotis TaxID=485448 RepID=A0ABY7V9S8_9GAMM|nr:hypothetical protein [Thalassomonas haliotis]WDE10333.1 hypothetical protein H3N35_18915 [Thalassomonas haliotis]